MEAIANGKNLVISTKTSVEICNALRGKTIEKAKRILEDAINKKKAIPYKRYVKSIPHRKGNIRTGRYPSKASKAILDLLKSAESNAKNKGMSSNLIIKHISSHKGESQSRYGRKMGKKAKRTHIKIVLEEKK